MRGALLLFLNLFVLTFITFAHEERNFLQDISSTDGFEDYIISDCRWVAYPKYNDRKAWLGIPENIRNEFIKKREDFLNFKWSSIHATSYLDFARTGDRGIMEKPYSERQNALESFVMAELMEGKGSFPDQIINDEWIYCEQTYFGFG